MIEDSPIYQFDKARKAFSDLHKILVLEIGRVLRLDKLLNWLWPPSPIGKTITLKDDPAAQAFVIVGVKDSGELVLVLQSAVKIVLPEEVSSF